MTQLADELVDELLNGQQSTAMAQHGVPVKTGSKPHPLESFWRGQKDFGQGVRQKLSGYDPQYAEQVSQEVDAYNARQGGDFDPFRFLGNVANPTAAIGGGSTVAGKLLYGGLGGGLGSFLQFNPQNDLGSDLFRGAVGAGIGGAANVAVPWAVGKVVGGGQKISNIADDVGNISKNLSTYSSNDKLKTIILQQNPNLNWNALGDEIRSSLLSDARDMLAKNGSIDPVALARKVSVINAGGTPTRSMVTRNPADWTEEQDLQKLLDRDSADPVSGLDPLSKILIDNDRAFKGTVQNIADKTRGAAGTKYDTGLHAASVINDISDQSQKVVSDLYKQVRQAHGDKTGIDYKNVIDVLDGLKDNAYASQFHDSVIKRVSRLLGNEHTLTVNKAEELRKFVGTLPDNVSGVDVTGWKSQIRKAIDDDVISSVGDDFFKGSRAAAKARFDALENPAIQKIIKTYGELGQDKAAQKFVDEFVVGGSPGDIEHLFNVIKSHPKGELLLSDIRRRVIEDIREASIGAQGRISGNNLNKAINKIGDQKLQYILDADSYASLKQFQEGLHNATVEPIGAAPSRSNTPQVAARIAKMSNRGGAYLSPVTTIAQEVSQAQRLGRALKATPTDTTARDAAQASFRKKAEGLAKYLMAPQLFPAAFNPSKE